MTTVKHPEEDFDWELLIKSNGPKKEEKEEYAFNRRVYERWLGRPLREGEEAPEGFWNGGDE